jgi:putative ABC transport system permease protein
MSWLGAIIRRSPRDPEIEKELRFHIDQQIDAYVRSGISRAEAVRRARLEFGGLAQVKEECRDVRIVRWLDDVARDLRCAVRGFRGSPLVFGTVALTLALGIGANTAIFSVINSLLLRALPVQEPERLAILTWTGASGSGASGSAQYYWSFPVWDEIHRRQLFDDAAAWNSGRVNLSAGGESDFVDGLWASGSFFRVLGVPALVGRTLSDGDDQPGGGNDGPVAMIGYSFWQQRFGGAPDVVGRTVFIGKTAFRVVGICPPRFFGVEVGKTFDIVAPIADETLVTGLDSRQLSNRLWLGIVARLKPEQTLADATSVLRGVQSQVRYATMPKEIPDDYRDQYLKEPFKLVPAATGMSTLRGQYRRPLFTLMGVVTVVLLIACANIANLLLARSAGRRREMAARLALGASRWRLVRQLLLESALLASGGALLGMLMASTASRFLARQLSTQTNVVFLDLTLDWRVMVFTIAVTTAAVMLFGLIPAFSGSNGTPIEALREVGHGTSRITRAGWPNVLIVAQIALALVLVVAAGLFIRSFVTLITLPAGFERNAYSSSIWIRSI